MSLDCSNLKTAPLWLSLPQTSTGLTPAELNTYTRARCNTISALPAILLSYKFCLHTFFPVRSLGLWGHSDLSPHYYRCPVMAPMEEGKLIARFFLVWLWFLSQKQQTQTDFVIIINSLICFALSKFLPFQI